MSTPAPVRLPLADVFVMNDGHLVILRLLGPQSGGCYVAVVLTPIMADALAFELHRELATCHRLGSWSPPVVPVESAVVLGPAIHRFSPTHVVGVWRGNAHYFLFMFFDASQAHHCLRVELAMPLAQALAFRLGPFVEPSP